MSIILLVSTFLIIIYTSNTVQAEFNIQLNVKETLGITRNDEMVHNGIPVARDDNITTTTKLIIKDASGTQIPATFEVLSRWAGGMDDVTKPIKWLLVSFPASVSENETISYYLTTGTPSSPETKIVVRDEGDTIVVNTGPAKFVINKKTLSFFESISLINDSAETVVLENNGGSTSQIAGQHLALANTPKAVVIERSNDHYLCIRAEGTYANNPVGDNARPLYYKIRYEFFAGSPTVTIYHKFFWNGYNGDIAFAYPSNITVDNISLVFPDMANYSSTDVYADAATFLTGALTSSQTASVEQRLRSVFSNPNQALVRHGSSLITTKFASQPMLINRSTNGVIATTIDHMQYFEPQAMETDHTGKITVNVMAENQIFANAQGTWARVGVSVLPPGATYEDTVSKIFAPINHRLFAFPDSIYVTNSKVFLELPNSPGVSPNDKLRTYYDIIKSVTAYTESFLLDEGFHGLMTWGSLVRYKSETGSGTGWDKIYSGATLTDYHNAWNSVVVQYLYEGDPTVLYDMSFIGARRMLHTQIIQTDDTSTSSRARGYMGWAPAGYRQYRSDPNSSHSYFENLYNYYYMTGDMEVIEVLKSAGETFQSWYTRNNDGNLNDPNTPGVSWVGYIDRVGFQHGTIMNFLGHAYDADYLEDFVHMYNHVFSQNVALLSNGDGHEYGFVTGSNGAPSGFKTSQFWMCGLYFMHGLSMLHNEWGDLTLGSTALPISRVYEAVARSLKEYVSNIHGDGTWGGKWSNTAYVDYSGDRIGGAIVSVTHGSSGGDQYLWNTGKVNVMAAVIRGGYLSGDSDLITFGKEGIDWLMSTSSFNTTDRYPWGKINGLMFSRLHHSMFYVTSDISISPTPDIKANGPDGSVTPTDNLTVTVALDPGSRQGENADWWIAADTPFGWYYFDAGTMSWTYAGVSYTDLSPTYQGLLFDLSTFEVLNMSDLPVGTYTFYFVVDTNMNNVLDFDEFYYDSIDVNIMP